MVEKCKLSGNPLERASRPSGGWMAERLTRLPTSKNPLEIYRRSFPLLNSEEKKLPANPGAERATSTEQPPSPPRCSGPHPPTCATTHLTNRPRTHSPARGCPESRTNRARHGCLPAPFSRRGTRASAE